MSKARPNIAAKYTQLDLDADIILMNGPAAAVRGREFLSSEMLPAAGWHGNRVERGVGIAGGMDGLMLRRSMGTYMPLHALSCKKWASALVAAAGD